MKTKLRVTTILKYLVTIIGLLALSTVIGIGLAVHNAPKPVILPPRDADIKMIDPKPPKLAPATGTPILLEYAAELGIKLPDGLTLVLEDKIPDASNLDPTLAQAIYVRDTKTIHIKSGATVHATKEYVAYEYLHYVWNNVTTPEQQAMVNAEGDRLMLTSPTLKANMANFATNSQSVYNDERHSNICTRVPVTELSAAVDAYCNSFIPNREAVLGL